MESLWTNARINGMRKPSAWILFTLALTLTTSGTFVPSAAAAPGEVPEIWMKIRKHQYLQIATETWDASNPLHVRAHLERDAFDPSYTLEREVPADAWNAQLALVSSLEDLRDFALLDLMLVYLEYGDHPALPPELMTKVEQAIIGFKYWLTDPTPEGAQDNSVYWTENHQFLYYALEYLAGSRFPDTVFTVDGKSGADKRKRGAAAIRDWFDRKARLGFNEWHSNVYYAVNLNTLFALADHAPDADIAELAKMMIDMTFLDIAIHNQRGAFGVTHGRSEKKDKSSSLRELTWDYFHYLFANSKYGFQRQLGAVHLACLDNYELPAVLMKIAWHKGTFVDRERMGIPINETGPFDPAPVAPYGFSYSDPEDLAVWWGMGAFTAWPVVPLTLQTLERYGLWSSNEFAPYQAFRMFVDDPVTAQFISMMAAPGLNRFVHGEVNTYTWRSKDVMLSSALAHRSGFASWQAHAWQATLDANAIVFTNHPAAPLIPSSDWDFDLGYFTGEASEPKAAQHENVGIYIYAPAYPPQNPPPFEAVTYQPLTHAFFPQDHFDEVVQDEGWTFGRFRNGYVALYSWRPAEFLPYGPEFATDGMTKPFDLVAPGGANNVWIVEVGRKADWGSFDEFRTAIAMTAPVVTDLGVHPEYGLPIGFHVVYASPSQGEIEFGSFTPLAVEGDAIPQSDFPRFDNPWVQAPIDGYEYTVEYGCQGLSLDFETAERDLYRNAWSRCRVRDGRFGR